MELETTNNTVRLKFLMKILDHKDTINQIIVETAIHRVSCLNRTVLRLLIGLDFGQIKKARVFFTHIKKPHTKLPQIVFELK